MFDGAADMRDVAPFAAVDAPAADVKLSAVESLEPREVIEAEVCKVPGMVSYAISVGTLSDVMPLPPGQLRGNSFSSIREYPSGRGGGALRFDDVDILWS